MHILGTHSTYKKLAVQCSADTFEVNQTLVLRINICGENRQLLVAANRYRSCYGDSASIKLTALNQLYFGVIRTTADIALKGSYTKKN
mgnify:CR=1 FL=1